MAIWSVISCFLHFLRYGRSRVKWFDSIPEVKLKKIVRPGYFVSERKTGRDIYLPDGDLGSE